MIFSPTSLSYSQNLPPAPTLISPALPIKLLGGLVLFGTSTSKRDKSLTKQLLLKAQEILERDPLICMELGRGLEAGGVYCSSSSIQGGVHQLVMEFQLNGGNSWAQCRCHGFQILKDDVDLVEVVSLKVSNMDAALNGGWVDLSIPKAYDDNDNDDEQGEYRLPFIPNTKEPMQ
eukprot:scaffold361_cov265-Chaetoceros_neogracile.AAC.12